MNFKRLIFTISIILITCLTTTQVLARGYSVGFLSPKDQLNFEELAAFIEDFDLRSVEDVLAQLKIYYPNSLDDYVLMYKSRSLQEASYLNPRAIVLSGSREMVFSFNGHQKQRGHSRLEVMQFRRQSRSFEFFEIAFNKNEPTQVSRQANPKRCLNCHQSPTRSNVDPRPNWEPYNFWPGTYGGVVEDIFATEEAVKAKVRLGLFSKEHIKEHPSTLTDGYGEAENIKIWLEDIKPNHPRYKSLGDLDVEFVTEFTKVLAHHNSHRIARLIQKDKEIYKIYRYGIATMVNTFSGCRGRLFHATPNMQIPKYPHEWPTYRHPIKGLEEIFEPLGIDTTDWSMDFLTQGRLNNDKNRLRNPHSDRAYLDTALFESDPDAFDVSCSEAAKKSVELLTEFYQSGQHQERIDAAIIERQQAQAKPLIQRCISCHVEEADSIIPYIPFDQANKLRQALSNWGPYPRGSLRDEILYRIGPHAIEKDRMPLGPMPTQEQRQQLTNYIRSL